MAKRREREPKIEELKRTGTLNPHAESVTDPLFQQNPFFDPRDLLQARYEMLRRHTAEQMSILDAAASLASRDPRFIKPKSLSNDWDWRAYCRLDGDPRVGTS